MGEQQTPFYLRGKGLTKRYGRAREPALKGVDLTIPADSIYGVLGPNGAGKTTLLSILCGLRGADSGTVELRSGKSVKASRARIGIVPQEVALYPKLTAAENLAFFGGLYGLKGSKLRDRISTCLELVGLSERASDRVETFSTGMSRRLNLAAGLLHEPELLLLDEPTVGIDPQSRNRIFETILDLKTQHVTIVYTTHYMEEAAQLCDRLAILDHGEILVEQSPKELVERMGVYRVELHAPESLAELDEALRQTKGVTSVEREGGVLSVTVKDGAAAMDVITALPSLAKEGEEVSLRRVSEPSLESVFLSLTGRSMRDQVGG